MANMNNSSTEPIRDDFPHIRSPQDLQNSVSNLPEMIRIPVKPDSHSGRLTPPLEEIPAELSARSVDSDDSPTIISKTLPKPVETRGSGDFRGRILAHFELIEQIGAGGMAAVLKARDMQLDRFVALKILPPDLAQDSENIKRFHQEARAAAKLDHENIARVFFCAEDQNLHFIAFEFVEGDNLRIILDRHGPLAINASVNYLIQITSGLCHASTRGVVHRDIKPSNIIITPQGRAKLVDMGLARSLENQQDGGLTQSGVTLGTFDYISPEQAMDPRDADVRSDIYSLGCTFYHLMTGRPPVPEGTAARKLHHHHHVKPTDPRELVSGLPDEIALILAHMMAKNPRERYQTANDLLHDLMQIASHLGIKTDVPEGLFHYQSFLPHRNNLTQPILWGLLAVASVIGLVLMIDQKEPAPVPRFPRQVTGAESKLASSFPGEKDVSPRLITPETEKKIPSEVVRFTGRGRDLPKFLEENQNAESIEIVLSDDVVFELNESSERGLIARASKSVSIKAAPGLVAPPTLKMTNLGVIGLSKPSDLWSNTLAALTIDSPTSKIEGIRVVVQSGGSLDCQMVGICYKGGIDHQLRNCSLIQVFPKEGYTLAGILLDSGSKNGTKVTQIQLESNLFVGYSDYQPENQTNPYRFRNLNVSGLQAVVVNGPAQINCRDCSFGPYESVIHFLQQDVPRNENNRSSVNLDNNSILAGNQTAVFDLADGSMVSLSLRECLLSSESIEESGSVVIRSSPGSVIHRFQGFDNRYHNFGSFWNDRTRVIMDLPLDQNAPKSNFRDERSLVMTFSPWESTQPITLLESQKFLEAFKIKDSVRELRQQRFQDRPLGSRTLMGQEIVRGLPVLDSQPKTARKIRFIQPGIDDSFKGIYPSLSQALESSQPGDNLLIRHNGLLPIGPLLRLEKKTLDVTIRADSGYHPILVAGESFESSVPIFKLYDGKIRLEGLEIRLQGQRQISGLTLVSFVGDGRCEIINCLLTLDRGTHDTLLNLAIVEPDARSRTMGKVTGQEGPQLLIEDSFIRGEGDLASIRANRPLELEMTRSLAALNGSLIAVTQGMDSSPTGTSPVRLKFTQDSFYLNANLINWKVEKDSRFLTSIRCNANGCAFLPATNANALIRLEVPESDLAQVTENLTWSSRENVFGNFSSLFDQPGLPGMNLQPLSAERWEGVTGDKTSKFKIQLSNPPTNDVSFVQITPLQFRLAVDSTRMDSSNWGPDLVTLQKLVTDNSDR